MANIFQKIFLSRNEVALVDIIKNSKIQSRVIYDDYCMETKTHYLIDKEKVKVSAMHHWHFAQGDNYSLNVNMPHSNFTALTQQFAKKIFMRMEKAYHNQKEH